MAVHLSAGSGDENSDSGIVPEAEAEEKFISSRGPKISDPLYDYFDSIVRAGKRFMVCQIKSCKYENAGRNFFTL